MYSAEAVISESGAETAREQTVFLLRRSNSRIGMIADVSENECDDHYRKTGERESKESV